MRLGLRWKLWSPRDPLLRRLKAARPALKAMEAARPAIEALQATERPGLLADGSGIEPAALMPGNAQIKLLAEVRTELREANARADTAEASSAQEKKRFEEGRGARDKRERFLLKVAVASLCVSVVAVFVAIIVG